MVVTTSAHAAAGENSRNVAWESRNLFHLTGAVRQSSSDYMSLAPHEPVCKGQEFLLGLALATHYFDSSVYNFDAWLQALGAARARAASGMK